MYVCTISAKQQQKKIGRNFKKKKLFKEKEYLKKQQPQQQQNLAVVFNVPLLTLNKYNVQIEKEEKNCTFSFYAISY